MKTRFLITFFIFILLIVGTGRDLSLPKTVAAAESDKIFYLPETKEFNGLFVKSGRDITIDGTINGETYLFGENIVVNGNINGDLIVVGLNVDIDGHVSENARIIAGKTIIAGLIDKNISVVSNEATFENRGIVGGNMLIVANQGQILGNVGGEFYALANDLFLDAQINKSATANSKTLTIGKTALFLGDFNYSAKNKIRLDKKQIQGKIIFVDKNKKSFFSKLENFFSFFSGKLNMFFKVFGLLGYLIVGLILFFIFPKNWTNVSRQIESKPLASFIFGFLFFALFPLICLLTALTLVGIPLSIFGVMILMTIYLISQFGVNLAIGNLILKDDESKFFPFLVGFFILQVLFQIPFLGTLLKIIVLFLGTGGILLSKFGKYSK